MRLITIVSITLIILSTMISIGSNTIDIIGVLKEKALNIVVEGNSHIDPGDYRLQLDDIIVGLWKRIYGYGYVNVTDQGILVKAAFSKASMGMAGIYIEFTGSPESFNANMAIKILEDYGGVIEVILHSSWYNGTGGDKPGNPLTQIIVYPKYGLALIGNTQKSIGKTGKFNIRVDYENNTSILTVNGVTVKTSIENPPKYITLMALSTDPGLNITFLVEYFNISYRMIKNNTITLTYNTVDNNTTTMSTHTCTRSTPEIETVDFATNTTVSTVPTSTTKITGTIISNATITIVYPNGTTQTSIVPVTRKPVSGEQIISIPEENTSISTYTSTSSVEDRVFNTTFYMILLVAVIVIAVASLVFSRKPK